MDHITNAPYLVGGFIFIVGIVLALRAMLKHHMQKAAPFRDYFGANYDRELLEHSSSSETEDWRADRHSSFTPLRLHDTGNDKRR
jgi:hypothetical protein